MEVIYETEQAALSLFQAEMIERVSGTTAGSSLRGADLSLCAALCSLIPQNTLSLIDVGAGSAKISSVLKDLHPNINIVAADPVARRELQTDVTFIETSAEDLPFEDKTFENALFSNVLHHASNPGEALKEAIRCCQREIFIKDHVSSSALDYAALLTLDVFGNCRAALQGVSATGRYYSLKRWLSLFHSLPLNRVRIYHPLPLRSGWKEKIARNTREAVFVLEVE